MSKTESQPAPASVVVTINGERSVVPAGLTLSELLGQLGVANGKVAVERNRTIAPRSQFDSIMVAEGDELEIVRFVGGG